MTHRLVLEGLALLDPQRRAPPLRTRQGRQQPSPRRQRGAHQFAAGSRRRRRPGRPRHHGHDEGPPDAAAVRRRDHEEQQQHWPPQKRPRPAPRCRRPHRPFGWGLCLCCECVMSGMSAESRREGGPGFKRRQAALCCAKARRISRRLAFDPGVTTRNSCWAP